MRIVPENFAFVAALGPFGRSDQRPAIAEKISVCVLRTEDEAGVGTVTDGKSDFFCFGFFGRDIESQIITAGGFRIDLQHLEKPGPHQLAKFFIEHIRAVSFAVEGGKPVTDIAGSQSFQSFNGNSVKSINRAGRDRDRHRNVSVAGFVRLARGFDFDRIITAGFEVGLQPPRNVIDAPVGVRLGEQVEHLPAQRLSSVNGVAVKSKLAEKILPALVHGNCYVDAGTVFSEPKLRSIDDSVQIPFIDVIATNQIGTLLHIRGDKRQRGLQP